MNMNIPLRRCAIALAISGLSQAASAFDVMGCSVNFGDNAGNVRRCIEGKADERVRQARSGLERDLDAARRAKADADRRAQDAERRAQEALRRIETDPNLARAAGEKQFLQTFRELGLESVFDCLRATGAQQEIQALAADMRTNPAQAARSMLERGWQRSESTVARLVDDSIRIAETSGIDELRRTLNNPERQVRRFAELQPGTRCLMQHMSPDSFQVQAQLPALRQLALSAQTRLAAEKIGPAATRMASRQIQALMAAVLTGPRPAVYRPTEGGGAFLRTGGSEAAAADFLQVDDETKTFVLDLIALDAAGIASNVFARHKLLPGVRNAAGAVTRYTNAVAAQNPARADIDAAADAANGALDMRFDVTGPMQIEIGMGILKSLGTNYIETDGVFFKVIPGGGMIIDTLYSSLETGVGSAMNVVHGSAGLVPEAGAYVVTIGRTPFDGAKEFAGGAIKWGMKKILVKAFGDFMDETTEVLKIAAGPELDRRLGELRARHPMFAGMLDGMQREAITFLADAHLKDLQRGVQDYNESVRALVRATRTRGAQ